MTMTDQWPRVRSKHFQHTAQTSKLMKAKQIFRKRLCKQKDKRRANIKLFLSHPKKIKDKIKQNQTFIKKRAMLKIRTTWPLSPFTLDHWSVPIDLLSWLQIFCFLKGIFLLVLLSFCSFFLVYLWQTPDGTFKDDFIFLFLFVVNLIISSRTLNTCLSDLEISLSNQSLRLFMI